MYECDRLLPPAICLFIIFFFSSRRRHTRCGRDWSSDVCSSDLLKPDTTLWRLGDEVAASDNAYPRFMPVHAHWTRTQLDQLPGLSIHDLMGLPLDRKSVV